MHHQPNCLFVFNQPRKQNSIVIPFSFLSPVTRGVFGPRSLPSESALPSATSDALVDLVVTEPTSPVTPKLETARSVEARNPKRLLGWDFDRNGGLSRAFHGEQSRLGFGYSDIFETHSNSEKGGHGPGVYLRYRFRR
jgi:hypothetical protein